MIRKRNGQRQIDLAQRAQVPREDVLRVEAERIGDVNVDRVRRLFRAAGGRARVAVWWNGAAADRLLDERHAAMVERTISILRRRGWSTEAEVSFSGFGERGSIDVLAGFPMARAVAVCEIKTVLGSIEETNRTLDAKERLAPRLAVARFGWTPRVLGRILILPADNRSRRAVARHALTMASVYSARRREVRRWIRSPDRPLRVGQHPRVFE